MYRYHLQGTQAVKSPSFSPTTEHVSSLLSPFRLIEEIKGNLNLWSICYYSVQNRQFYRLQRKDSGLLPSEFPTKIPYAFLFPMRVICAAHLILLYLIILITLGED
jgi:hypothetical protein